MCNKRHLFTLKSAEPTKNPEKQDVREPGCLPAGLTRSQQGQEKWKELKNNSASLLQMKENIDSPSSIEDGKPNMELSICQSNKKGSLFLLRANTLLTAVCNTVRKTLSVSQSGSCKEVDYHHPESVI